MPNFGLSFAPPTTPDRREQASAAAQLGPTQRAIQVLSLHLPRILGARAIAPRSLLAPERPASPLSPEAALTQNAIQASGSPVLGGRASDIAGQLADLLTSGTAFDQFAPKTPDLTGARPIPTAPDQPAPSGPKVLPPSIAAPPPRFVVDNPNDVPVSPVPTDSPFGTQPFTSPVLAPNLPGGGGATTTIAAPTGPNVFTAPGAESRLSGGVTVNAGPDPLTVDEIRRRFSPLSASFRR